MKKLIVLLFICNFVNAQDTIRFLDGDVRDVQVVEATNFGVKYYSHNLPKGKLLFSAKKEIVYIRYANGLIDSLNGKGKVAVDGKVNLTVVDTINKSKSSNAEQHAPNIKISGNFRKLYYRGQALSDRKLKQLVYEFPNAEKRNLMIEAYKQIYTYKKKQHIHAYIGLASLILWPAAATTIDFASELYGYLALAGVLVGVVSIIPSEINALVNRHKRKKKTIELISIYNSKT